MKRMMLCFLSFITAWGADAQLVKGKVTGREWLPVDNAAVVMQDADSAYVGAAVTDSLGFFSIRADVTSFRLIVHHLLYETYERLYTGEDEVCIELEEKEHTLGEVVARGERLLARLADGKITYDMPRLLEGKVVSNAYESLLRLPGVREQGGALTLAGSTGVTILVNGQMTSMPAASLLAALKMLPYDRVQSAEIMYSTPPQYHIRGAAINIVLKDGASGEGLSGQVNTGYEQKYYANYAAGLSLRYSTPKLSTDLDYSFNRVQTCNGVDIYSNHLLNGEVYGIEQFNRGNRKSGVHAIRLNTDYKLPGGDKLGVTYTSQITGGLDNNENSTGTFSLSTNHKEADRPVQMHNALLSYTSGFGLKAGVEYTGYREAASQHFVEKKENKENDFEAWSAQTINRYRVFADQSHTAGAWKLTYGAQYLYAADHSSQRYHSLAGQDMSASGMDSRLKEYTGNLYAGFERTVGDNLSLSASLTGEYYKLAGFAGWTAFPALEANYSVSPGSMLLLSFSSDKVYPAYWALHGGTGYLNGYAELHGNPLLRPYREYSGQLSYILKSKYILTAYCNYLKDYSDQLPYQSPTRLALIYQSLNYDYRQAAGLNLIVPFTAAKAIDSRLTLNGFYDKVKSSAFHELSFENDNFVFYSRLDNTVTLSSRPAIKLEFAAACISRNIQGPATLSALWNVEAGLKWSFWHDMAELRLKGADLFNSWTPDMTMKYASQDVRMNLVPDSRTVSVSFTLRLGDFNPSDREVDVSRFGTK
ncbi:MAG: outer membrane beta-barrel protein [Tannerellaceae bacterium]|nr:outer membrane beta-barrel protein [Tannerellaceae bacterium]